MKYVFVLNTVLYTCLLSVISDQLICPVYEKSLRFQDEKSYQLIGELTSSPGYTVIMIQIKLCT